MLEQSVEQRLKEKLTARGFKVLKLITPGTQGTMDRLIIRPKWSPGPPWFVEVKKPGKHERKLQEAVRDDWLKRGVAVLPAVSTYDEVDALYNMLLNICNKEHPDGPS